MRASSKEIEQILSDLKSAIDNGKFIPVNRRKNLRTLAMLGLSWQDAKDEIRDLQEKHYISGPCVDRDYPQSDKLWVFKKSVDGQVIYIKFKVEYQKDSDAKILSFHIDEKY